MAKYIMSSRRAGRLSTNQLAQGQISLSQSFSYLSSAQIYGDSGSEDSRTRRMIVFEADPEEVEERRNTIPSDVIIEPEVNFWPTNIWAEQPCPVDLQRVRQSTPQTASTVAPFVMSVTTEHGYLAEAQVTLFARGPGGICRSYLDTSDRHGEVQFYVDPGFQVTAALISPSFGYWPTIARGPHDGQSVACSVLPMEGPEGWWHKAHKINLRNPDLGKGIRVGVIDTGCGPHRNLSHVVPVGTFIGGNRQNAAIALDVDRHGTHVAGIIGARPSASGEYSGIAPQCDLFVARVFEAGSPANQADIASAIEALAVESACHLINLSLGSPSSSEVLHDAIQYAAERGTLCVCAAGNTASSVIYPAAFPEVVAVSALGLVGWGPPGSLSASRLPENPDKFGTDNLYLANFSSYGPELGAAAPGVGIISTVPQHNNRSSPYAAMDGSSMASPAACGAFAVTLGADLGYMSMLPDEDRTKMARAIVDAKCRSIGLLRNFEGRGVPSA